MDKHYENENKKTGNNTNLYRILRIYLLINKI